MTVLVDHDFRGPKYEIIIFFPNPEKQARML